MFKLQKNVNSKSILTKNMYMIRGGYDKYNSKLLYSMIASNVGINIVEYKTGVIDNPAIGVIRIGVGTIIIYEALLLFSDYLRQDNSIKKLKNLEKLLKEKEIDVNLFDESMLTIYSDKINNTFIAEVDFFNGKKLLSANDETFYYLDNDKEIDITNEVKSTLTKKKSKQSK